MPVQSEVFIGERLQVAREFRGLTQKQLGDAVAASHALVSLCETGKKKDPAKDLVEAYGSILGFEPPFFYRPLEDVFREDECSFRHRRTTPEKLKALPALFDAKGLEISQHFTPSKDGTRIPYFQVSRKGLKLDGSHPTLLNGYGGFEVSELPHYSGASGRAWLSQGGVLVLANIRGGGEYGPRWHQAALKQNRPRAYEDFAAVAKDLAARKVTSPKHLGILGGSNGGLLVGNMLTMYPELLGAVVCQVPGGGRTDYDPGKLSYFDSFKNILHHFQSF